MRWRRFCPERAPAWSPRCIGGALCTSDMTRARGTPGYTIADARLGIFVEDFSSETGGISGVRVGRSDGSLRRSLTGSLAYLFELAGLATGAVLLEWAQEAEGFAACEGVLPAAAEDHYWVYSVTRSTGRQGDLSRRPHIRAWGTRPHPGWPRCVRGGARARLLSAGRAAGQPGRFRMPAADFGQSRLPRLAHIDQIWAKFGQHCPLWANIGKTMANLGRTWCTLSNMLARAIDEHSLWLLPNLCPAAGRG